MGAGPTGYLRIGVIGLGRAGAMMLRAMASQPGIQVTAAADLHREHLDRFQEDFGGLAFDDAEALCASREVDVVYIASPHEYHADHAVMAATHGKHVLVEKPMALTLEDCDRMIEVTARAGVVLLVGHTASFNPGVQQMRQLVAGGDVGALAVISSNAYTDFLYRPRRPEELDTQRGGGIMYNQVPHQVDAARFVAGGMARSVRASAWALDPARPTEGCYAAFLTFESGAVASLVYSGYDHMESSGAARRALRAAHTPEEETQLRAKSGYSSHGSSKSNTQRMSLMQPELGVFVATCADADLRLVPEGVAVYSNDGLQVIPSHSSQGDPGRAAVLDELAQSVFGERPPVHDGRWAKATMEVCLAMRESAREQREVWLHHQAPVRC